MGGPYLQWPIIFAGVVAELAMFNVLLATRYESSIIELIPAYSNGDCPPFTVEICGGIFFFLLKRKPPSAWALYAVALPGLLDVPILTRLHDRFKTPVLSIFVNALCVCVGISFDFSFLVQIDVTLNCARCVPVINFCAFFNGEFPLFSVGNLSVFAHEDTSLPQPDPRRLGAHLPPDQTARNGASIQNPW